MEYDPPTDALSYFPDGDPVAMVVGRDTPQRPVARFVARGWNITAGHYDAVLEIHRASSKHPLLKRFCLFLSASDISILNRDHKGFYFSATTLPRLPSMTAATHDSPTRSPVKKKRKVVPTV